MTSNLRQADVLVIGAGMAGLCAAVRALEQGASVLVIEKGGRFGGSMALSNGLIWTFANTEQVREEIPDGDQAMQDFVVEMLPECLNWLESQGVELEPEQTFQWYGRGRRSNPAQMTPRLFERVQQLGGEFLLHTAMERLLTEQGEVVGVRAFGPDGAIEIRAKSVVLASGGFQGNAELLTRYISQNAHHMYLRSNPCSTGDGFIAAVEAGAATTPLLNTFYGHAMVAPPARFNPLEFQGMSQKHGSWSVALNLAGRRFTDESAGTGEEDLNFYIAQQDKATAVYIVDAPLSQLSGKNNAPAHVALSRARKAGGPVIDADTLEELAEKLGAWQLPPQQVLRTLHEFNAALKNGEGDTLMPPRRKHLYPIETGPFTAVLVRAGITYTCGGLQADLDMRVLRRSASVSTLPLLTANIDEINVTPIHNLFVAGCDLGGVSNVGYMGGLSQALVTGYTAGSSAAS